MSSALTKHNDNGENITSMQRVKIFDSINLQNKHIVKPSIKLNKIHLEIDPEISYDSKQEFELIQNQ